MKIPRELPIPSYYPPPRTMNISDNHHRLDYIEFAVSDVAAAKLFYAAVFGWTFTDYGPDYSTFHDGRISGGFRAGVSTATSTNPLVVMFARDLENTQAAVKAAKGTIVLPTHEFPGGRRFHFTDPNGLELAVWSNLRADGSKIE